MMRGTEIPLAPIGRDVQGKAAQVNLETGRP
jgi:hypothetical protein